MSQMKGQDKIPEKATFQEKKKKIRIMRVNLIQDLGKRVKAKIETKQEMLNVDLEELTDKQTEMNSTLEGINSKITEAEEWINDLKEWWKSSFKELQHIENRI